MKAWFGLVLLVAGFGAGWAVGRRAEREGVTAADAAKEEFAALKARAERAESEAASALEKLKRRPRENPNPNEPAGVVAPGSRSPYENLAAPTKETPAKSAPTAEQRTNRLNEIRGGLATLFQNHDGEKILAALKDLAAIVPEGRDDAMKLAVELNKDVNGAGELHLSMFSFYGALGDPAVRDLMLWSFENQATTPAEFRNLAAWSIPWALKPDDAIARYDAALVHETDHGVQRAIVSNLGSMNTPKAEAVLAKLFGDTTRDPSLRGEAAMALATSNDPAVQRAIETAALGDPEPKVQAAAKLSLIVRDPPATGCLVLQTSTDGNADAAGVRTGDIIVSYNGRAVATNDEIIKERDAAQAAGAESIPMLVVRDGREVTLTVKSGRLGLTNVQSVKKK